MVIRVVGSAQGHIHYEFIPEERTGNKGIYVDILNPLKDIVKRER
jgi:hypothetical protein